MNYRIQLILFTDWAKPPHVIGAVPTPFHTFAAFSPLVSVLLRTDVTSNERSVHFSPLRTTLL